MSRFEQLVDKLREQSGRELLILPGSAPQYRTTSGWSDLEESSLSPAQAQQACFSILNNDEKDVLTSKGQIKGSVFSKKGFAISYDLKSSWAGYTGYFEVLGLQDQDPDIFGVPEVVLETASRKQGLILLTGPSRSGKTTLMGLLLKSLSQSRASVVSFSRHPWFLRYSGKAPMMHFAFDAYTNQGESSELMQSADVIMIDSLQKASDWQNCFQALEQGKLVIATYEGLSIRSAVNRIIGSFALEDRQLAAEMLATHLHLATGQRLAPSEEEGSWSLASEVLVNTPEVRSRLLKSDWEEVYNMMKTKGEKTGMRTMNQSLLQLLLRRKVSLQVAYDMSPDIEELHMMMEKVGV